MSLGQEYTQLNHNQKARLYATEFAKADMKFDWAQTIGVIAAIAAIIGFAFLFLSFGLAPAAAIGFGIGVGVVAGIAAGYVSYKIMNGFDSDPEQGRKGDGSTRQHNQQRVSGNALGEEKPEKQDANDNSGIRPAGAKQLDYSSRNQIK